MSAATITAAASSAAGASSRRRGPDASERRAGSARSARPPRGAGGACNAAGIGGESAGFRVDDRGGHRQDAVLRGRSGLARRGLRRWGVAGSARLLVALGSEAHAGAARVSVRTRRTGVELHADELELGCDARRILDAGVAQVLIADGVSLGATQRLQQQRLLRVERLGRGRAAGVGAANVSVPRLIDGGSCAVGDAGVLAAHSARQT